MSKTLGNVVDPLDVIDTYSCDALRFTLATGAALEPCFLRCSLVCMSSWML